MEQPSQNIQNLQTMLRVISKAGGEIPSVIPDGIYGSQTADSVRAFQCAAGLPQTGSADEPTWRNVSIAYAALAPSTAVPAPLWIELRRDQVLSSAADNTHIYLVQAMLLALSQYYVNFPALTVTGKFDSTTEAAVRRLQKVSGLPETGQVDRRVWKYLTSLYRLAAGNGARDSNGKK
ncbi:MAG: peptidoglycan-binding protein [Oscillospiraceae bacterium]|nr:peptidoglycan-binding protein [Oscillospiraceae bacterium]